MSARSCRAEASAWSRAAFAVSYRVCAISRSDCDSRFREARFFARSSCCCAASSCALVLTTVGTVSSGGSSPSAEAP